MLVKRSFYSYSLSCAWMGTARRCSCSAFLPAHTLPRALSSQSYVPICVDTTRQQVPFPTSHWNSLHFLHSASSGSQSSHNEDEKNDGNHESMSDTEEEAGLLHELDHRARHAGIVEGSKALAEKISRSMEKHAGKRILKQTSEIAVERTTEHVIGHAGTSVVKHGENTVAKNVLAKTLEGAEKLADRGSGTALDRLATERVAEHVAERLSAKGEAEVLGRTTERIAEQTAERLSEISSDKLAEPAAKRFAEHMSTKTVARSMGERLAEHGEKSARSFRPRKLLGSLDRAFWRRWRAGKSAPLAAERSVEGAAERLGERSLERAAPSLGRSTSKHMLGQQIQKRGALVLGRIGRGALIAIPAMGGLFAIHIFRSDLSRCRQEWRQGTGLGSYCWSGAALADGVDALSHAMIVYSLLMAGTIVDHSQAVLLLEKLSLCCAITSTVLAVTGEFLSMKRRKDRKANSDG